MTAEESYHTRLTTATLQMWQVEQEYGYGLRSPDKSALYKELQTLTNLNKSDELLLELKNEHTDI